MILLGDFGSSRSIGQSYQSSYPGGVGTWVPVITSLGTPASRLLILIQGISQKLL